MCWNDLLRPTVSVRTVIRDSIRAPCGKVMARDSTGFFYVVVMQMQYAGAVCICMFHTEQAAQVLGT
jgi:hypothetical protein